MYKIAIVGAGILGRMLAIFLHERLYQVSLFEKDSSLSENSATATAAGMLCPWSEIHDSTDLVFHLGRKSLELWPKVLNKINAPHLYNPQGTWHIFLKDNTAEYQDFVDYLRRTDPSVKMEKKNVQDELFSSKYHSGFYLPQEASLDPRNFIIESNRYFEEKNIDCYFNEEITAIDLHHISTKNLKNTFDLVIDTRGIAAKNKLPGLRGVRGELLLVQVPSLILPSIVQIHHSRHPVYIVPRAEHRFIIGATSFEAEHKNPINIESCLELLSLAAHVNSKFLNGFILDMRVNLRPTFFDASPKIMKKNGIYYLNGLYRHGILLAPIIAEIFTNYLENNIINSDNVGLFEGNADEI